MMGNNILFKKILTLIKLLGSLTVLIILFGQACSDGFQVANNSSSSQGGQVAEGLPKDFSPMAQTKTTSMVYSRQILDNMISCSGIQKSNATIDAEYENRKGSLSEFGYATQVTAPMLMSVAALAGEVCNKLIQDEKAKSISARRIFSSVNFSSSPNSVSSSDLRDVTRRLARSCWSRNETDEEFAIVERNFNEAFNGTTGGAATTAGMLMVCSGILSSLSGIEM